MSFRFVHTADIHLDSPLRSLALRDADLAQVVGNASRRVFTRIIDLCLAETVDALLIAGDLYDGAQTSMKTARFLASELGRLDAAGIATFIIRGNHDALSKITRELVLPASVKVFGAKPEIVQIDTAGRSVAIHGISFPKPQAEASLLPLFAAPIAGAINIGMMHSSLNGAAGHDPYAPCALADLQATGFAYWALGHVHIRAEYPGPSHVVMPGIPQGRDVGEAGKKSVTLVTIDDDDRTTTEMRVLALAQFDRFEVSLDGLTDWPDLIAALKTALRHARANAVAETLVLRPQITGASPLAWRVLRDADLLLAEAQEAAAAIGTVWIDKLELALDPGQGAAPDASLRDLAALIDLSDPACLTEAETTIEALTKALPRELRDLFGADEAAMTTELATLLKTGTAEVLAHLAGDAA